MKDKLSVQFCGLEFKNPVVAASATPTRNFEMMKKCVEAGVGGLVGKSASFQRIEQIHPSPCFYVMYPGQARVGRFYSLYSTAQLAELPPQDYAREIEKVRPLAKENNCKIISDIMTGSLDEWKKMTEIFAPVSDMLELNVACPFGGELAGEEKKGCMISSNPELINMIIKAVREVTDLPLMIKLSIEGGDLVPISQAIEEIGVKAVHLTHRFTGLEIDINTGKPILSQTLSGYGGPWMGPLSRKWTAKVASATNLNICGGGGIDGWRDAIAHIMAGASIIQMAAAPMLRGHQVFTETVEGIKNFLDIQEHESISKIKGIALKHLKTLEKVPRRDVFRPRAEVDPDKCNGCGDCEKVCFYSAVKMEEKVAIVDKGKCVGCALCAQMCPREAIQLKVDDKIVPVFWEGARGGIAEQKRK